jgi:hypothetical protein
MNKMSVKTVLAAVILVSVPVFAQNGYVWPIKLAPDLSSRFCDHRAGHFHAGLDFRTNGKSGYKIYAIEDGYVYRVSIAHNGYGKALYIKLNDGKIAVYGHLSSLGEDLDEYVRKEQMKTKKYRQNLILNPGQFPVKKGQYIGLTGSSGSGAPHLHFEMRSESNSPVNPLKAGYSINDSAPPVFEKLAVRYYDKGFNLGDPCRIEFPEIERRGDEYIVPDTLIFEGDMVLAVSGGDFVDRKQFVYGYYGLKMFVNDSLAFVMSSDSLSYETTGQIDYVRDYRMHSIAGRRNSKDNDEDIFYRLYVPPGNRQFFWGGFDDNQGIINSDGVPGEVRRVRIEAVDESGNKAVLKILIKTPELPLPMPDFISYYKFVDTIEVDFLTYDEIFAVNTQFRNSPVESFSPLESRLTTKTWRRGGNIAYLNTLRIVAPNYKEEYRFRYGMPDGRTSPWIFFKDANETSRLMVHGSPGLLRVDYFPDSILTDLLIQIQSENVMFDLEMHQGGIGLFSTDIIDRELLGPTSVIIKKGSRVIVDTIISLYPVHPETGAFAYSPDSSLTVEFVDGSAFYPVYVLPSNGTRAVIMGKEAMVYEIRPLYFIADVPVRYELDLSRAGLSPEYLGAYGYIEKKDKWGFIEKAKSSKIDFPGMGLGRIALIKDDSPPTVSTIRPRGKIRSRRPALSCVIRDNISGIDLESGLEMKIDGIWVPAEYDIDTRKFRYKVKNSLRAGRHKLEIIAIDNQGNKTEKTSYFTILGN